MSDKPLLSIITVVYNAKREFERTAQSILNQDLGGVEWVVIDGGSSDGTLSSLDSVKDLRVSCVSEPDSGIYNAMNKGIDLAQGKYLQFLNAGDVFHADDVLSAVKKQLRSNEYDFVAGAFEIWSKSKRELIFHKEPRDFTRENFKTYGTGVCNHQSIFIRKSITPRYSERYRLKGELNWYFDICDVSDRNQLSFKNLADLTVVNYELGGAGNINYRLNLWEWILITYRRFGIFQVIKTRDTYRNFIRYSQSMREHY